MGNKFNLTVHRVDILLWCCRFLFFHFTFEARYIYQIFFMLGCRTFMCAVEVVALTMLARVNDAMFYRYIENMRHFHERVRVHKNNWHMSIKTYIDIVFQNQ